MSDATINDLTARLAALEAAIARLTAPAHAGAAAIPEVDGASGAEADRPARRDLLRLGSLALGAAAVGLAPRSVEAANGDPVRIGQLNLGTAQTRLNAGVANDVALHVANLTTGVPSGGIWGETESGGDESGGVGGQVFSPTGFNAGVFGTSSSSSGHGLFGEASAESGQTFGVRAECVSPDGFAVLGFNPNGNAVVGSTATAGGAALLGFNNGIDGALAGLFIGPVVVGGDFAVTGAKNAALPHPDGTHRLVYCVESPESWLEDFGKGQLAGSTADVVLDPDFTAVADMNDYHVFVTPYGEHCDLMVDNQTACGFRISARGLTANAKFSWRVVARRKDLDHERLPRITIPPAPKMPATDGADGGRFRAAFARKRTR